MTMPKSIEAYEDCERIFNAALSSEKGYFVVVETPGMATRMVQKLNSYRVLLRKQSKALYKEQPYHPAYGTSPFDKFKVSVDTENPQKVVLVKYAIKTVEEGAL